MILITGNMGYIGTVMTRFFTENSFDVTGLDTDFFRGCDLYDPGPSPARQIIKDIKDVTRDDLRGATSVIHLAALSNDPLGNMNPDMTYDINHRASVKLARISKEAGAERFIYSSSCSLYGIAADGKPLTEEGRMKPVTAYAKSKVMTENDVSRLADSDFHPVFMRNATVYGVSPRLRLDLVVNNLTAWAYLTGKVAIMSDGTPWRPIIHVEDLSRAFMEAVKAPIDKVHNQAFNVGIDSENYQIRDIAGRVERIVPGCKVEILNKTGSDERTYVVDFGKLRETFPGFRPQWNVDKGIKELYDAYVNFGLKKEHLEGNPAFFRLNWIKHLMDSGRLDEDLRWKGKGG
jgi:nucleoside-diphosphate-sugar epimerase